MWADCYKIACIVEKDHGYRSNIKVKFTKKGKNIIIMIIDNSRTKHNRTSIQGIPSLARPNQ